MKDIISIRGAREHNLKNINVDIPKNQFVVITGVSGSGKSSLAFDTIYAEGQRRYVESLSAYARQFLEMMEKPDVDHIEGLSPAISIEQKTTSNNPRSTVGTVTEIYDYMRLLYARVGIPYSPATGLPIESQTVSQMVDKVMDMPLGTKILILAPIVRGRKGEHKKELDDLRKKGFQRVIIDGTMHTMDDLPTINKKTNHDIDVVVDRIVTVPDIQNRLAESIESALKIGDDLMYVDDVDTKERRVFSAKFACPVSGFALESVEPRLFSFNNPHGACPSCDGLGVKIVFSPDLVVPDTTLSIRDGAIAPWNFGTDYHYYILEGLLRHFNQSERTPFCKLPQDVQDTILYGSKGKSLHFTVDDGYSPYTHKRSFEGVIPNIERRWRETESSRMREELSKYQNNVTCSDCGGYRLRPEALCVKVHEHHIGETSNMNIAEAYDWFNTVEDHLSDKHKEVGRRILKEICDRLGFLVNVGLGYLTLSRHAGTLSGGESQRIRLASQIGSGLTGVLYVLDEPSIGLHQRDNDRLLETLRRLRDLGNTVIVVEHDEDAIRTCDHLIDIGPEAGIKGGKIIAQGKPQDVIQKGEGLTAQYLNGSKSIPVPTTRRKPKEKDYALTLMGARANNLKNVTVSIPLGIMTCITGVSGSGKSTLIIETLCREVGKRLNHSREPVGEHSGLTGITYLDKMIEIDQSPIGRTPRSNPATYTGAFTPIREWFAGLPEAKARGYAPGRFSFNVKGGRCEACEGDGVTKIEMHFLADVYVECDQCKGKRYNRETLDIQHKGKSIADVLDMSVDEGLDFFQNIPTIRDKLKTLQQVGLGYMKIGQRANTLSGGEAQRIKLSKELSKRSTGQTLYVLDEPTTGLHFHDIKKLLEVLQTLVNQGNSVLIIEHNLEVIKTADWIIDMGPEGGDGGGQIVANGTPEDIAKTTSSYTGKYLAPYLNLQHVSQG